MFGKFQRKRYKNKSHSESDFEILAKAGLQELKRIQLVKSFYEKNFPKEEIIKLDMQELIVVLITEFGSNFLRKISITGIEYFIEVFDMETAEAKTIRFMFRKEIMRRKARDAVKKGIFPGNESR